MSVALTGAYKGNKKIEITHLPSGSTIRTDAPKDNQGEGTLFSPTDLVGAALGSCVLTIIAIIAEREKISVQGMHMRVEKEMSTSPRRIGELPLTIHLPRALTEEQRTRFEKAAHGCPVHHSLHPDIRAPITFIYDV